MRHIREYTTNWVIGFDEIVQYLAKHLPGECRIHHVGSTAIPDMPAKDVIDVDIECPQGSMGRVVVALSNAGYEHLGDRGIPTREAFRPQEGCGALLLPAHHLYACESGSVELRRHLAFRNYLSSHPERARWLADAKRRAADVAPTREAYIEAKDAAYQAIVAEATAWGRTRC